MQRSLNYELRTVGKRTGRNLFGATIEAEDYRVAIHLTSAGLGGVHPLFHGVSAEHTEQQWRALRKNELLLGSLVRAVIQKKKKKRSTSNTYGHGAQPMTHAAIENYISHLLPHDEDDLMETESVDVVIDSEGFRGEEIDQLTFKELEDCIEFYTNEDAAQQ